METEAFAWSQVFPCGIPERQTKGKRKGKKTEQKSMDKL